MEIAAHTVVSVVESSQPSSARLAARALADKAGFDEADSYRVGIVATELATNLVKHARVGEILLRINSDGAAHELEMIALDRGPGKPNVSTAMSDGHSTAGSAGIGLGAVRRMSDEFDIYSSVPYGTIVLARLRPSRSTRTKRHSIVAAGVAVAKAGEAECGDAWMLDYQQDGVVALLADGLGHGHFAAEAARAVVRLFNGRTTDGCADALATVHDGVRHTRGAAAAVVRIARSKQILTFAGIGNIVAAVVGLDSTRHAVSHNGTLGHEARHFREYTYPWPAAGLLVMHSDGLISHWSLDRYPGLKQRHPGVVAATLYRDFSRGRDDVSVVVAREAA